MNLKPSSVYITSSYALFTYQQLPLLQQLTPPPSKDRERERERENIVIHLPQNLQYKTTSAHTLITLLYKLINCKNEISFIYEPPITQ